MLGAAKDRALAALTCAKKTSKICDGVHPDVFLQLETSCVHGNSNGISSDLSYP